MKNKTLSLLTVVLFAASILILPASATTPTQVAGQWQSFQGVPTGGTPVSVSIEKAGANVFVTLHTYATYTQGSILGNPGAIDQTIFMTFHYSDPKYVKTLPTGTLGNVNSIIAAIRSWQPTNWTWNVDRQFTGAVLTTQGSFNMNLEAKGFGTLGYAGLTLEGTWVITGGSGGLSSLHGQGTWHSIGVQVNAYEGQVHFDP
jgi:hypothetical protein